MISTTAETATNETTTNETTTNETAANETPNPVKTTKSSYLFYFFTLIGGLLVCAYYFLPKQTMLLAHELNVEPIKKPKIEPKSFGTLVKME